jgi:hypothetical protein
VIAEAAGLDVEAVEEAAAVIGEEAWAFLNVGSQSWARNWLTVLTA